jgi:prevent-host-death family protein
MISMAITVKIVILTISQDVTKEPRIFNVAEAKRRFSDLLGRVAYGGETILITRRGRSMAKLVPVGEATRRHPAEIQGWLEDDDPFFDEIDAVVAARPDRRPRVVRSENEDSGGGD